jgi:hypothetical protein
MRHRKLTGKMTGRSIVKVKGEIPDYVTYQAEAISAGVTKEYHFSYEGRPLSQKNDLVVRFKSPGRYKGGLPFIGHTPDLLKSRNEISTQIYSQFLKQGGKLPIDWLFELDIKFYLGEKWETDLDNLPAIILDAMQGFKLKNDNTKGFTVCQVIKNDKLLRKMTAEKFFPYDPRYTGVMRTEIILRPYVL